MPKRLRILVMCGGPSSEHEVSLRTAEMIIKNLNRTKYEPHRVVIQKNGTWKFDGNAKSLRLGNAITHLKQANFNLVFIAMHGAFGEDGRMQALLEWAGIAYTGSKVASSAMAMNKEISNILYLANGLSVPRYAIFNKGDKEYPAFSLPVVVKPVNGGSSVGVSVVKTKKELAKAIKGAFKEDERVMIQEYIQGREFTCGVLEDKNGNPFTLPPTEIIPQVSSFFNYEAKYKTGGSLEITPAQLPKGKTKELQKIALQAHRILGCRGMSRSDFILKGGAFFILETNTIPGMTEISLLPQAAQEAGIDFPSLLDLIIHAGLSG